MVSVVLLQKNLRLHDNPALRWAIEQKNPILIFYIPEKQKGVGHRWWRNQSLESFGQSLAEQKMSFFVYEDSITSLKKLLVKVCDEYHVAWNDEEQGWEKTFEEAEIFEGNYLFSPETIGKVYQRYTPYLKKVSKLAVSEPLSGVKFSSTHLPSKSLKDHFIVYTKFLKNEKVEADFSQYHEPSEERALKQWKSFLKSGVTLYDKARDIPADEGTSELSAALHFGQISIRKIWHDLEKVKTSEGKKRFKQELIWREFCHQLLYYFPTMTTMPLQEKYQDFWWQESSTAFRKWKEGQTGFPIVDAGMRQLLETGTMHNRVRMIVASFLTKHLGVDWRKGAAWFMDRLVDADVAQNYANWQWVAGCGADAAPFFRIFNPVLQTKRFDPQANYIKRWIPELASCEAKDLVSPKQNFDRKEYEYPEQMIELNEARDEALAQFKSLKKKK